MVKPVFTSYAYLQTGKEYYLTLVNSIWPDSDPFDATVDRPGIRIDLVWLKQGFYYVLYSLIIGIELWIVTWKDVVNDEDNYAELLATTGLVACLINVVNIPLLWCVGIIKFLFTQIMRIIQHIQKADSEGTN